MTWIKKLCQAYKRRQDKKRIVSIYGPELCDIGLHLLNRAEREARHNDLQTVFNTFKDLTMSRDFVWHWVVSMSPVKFNQLNTRRFYRHMYQLRGLND